MNSADSEQRKYWDDLAEIDPNAAIIDPKDCLGFKNSYLAEIRDEAICEGLSRHGVAAGILLDVGCGTGSATHPLLLSGHRVLGVDISLGLLRHARSRCGDENCLFIATDGERLPLAPNCFDAAIIYVVLSYILSDHAVCNLLSDIKTALRPGAPLIMIEQARTRRRVCEGGRKVQRTCREWEGLLESAGFLLKGSAILRHGRFPTTPLIRAGFIPRAFWPALRHLEGRVASRTGVFKWDYAEICFEALA